MMPRVRLLRKPYESGAGGPQPPSSEPPGAVRRTVLSSPAVPRYIIALARCARSIHLAYSYRRPEVLQGSAVPGSTRRVVYSPGNKGSAKTISSACPGRRHSDFAWRLRSVRCWRRWLEVCRAEARLVERARIIVLAAQGPSNAEIGRRVGCHVDTIRQWRWRFVEDGLAS